MVNTEFIAAIELGSSKIVGSVGKKNSDGSIEILAYAEEDSSSFIKKGIIYNIDKTALSLTSLINKLEGSLNYSISKVYVGIGGQSLRTIRNVISRNINNETGIVTQELVDSICDENLETPLINNDSIQLDILDVIPQEFKVDNNPQPNPVGALGNRIEGRFLNIIARSALKRNIQQCFEHAKIEIAEILISPLVTADILLTESERRSGCALIDFGADTTTISVYKNNILRFLTVLPLGGNSITHDITSLQIEEEEAEQLKIDYGKAILEEEGEEEEIETCLLEDGRNIEISKLNNIVEARAEEIIANVWNQIQLSGYEEKLLAGLIITGGASNLQQLTDLLRKRTRIEKIRNAKFTRNTVSTDLADIIKKDGTQNTIVGLLNAGTDNCGSTHQGYQSPDSDSPTIFSDEEMGNTQEVQDAKREEELEAQKEKENKKKERKEKEKKQKSFGKSIFGHLNSFSKNFLGDDDDNEDGTLR